jgi:AbrB family looped-hinge helix DNA binding protein
MLSQAIVQKRRRSFSIGSGYDFLNGTLLDFDLLFIFDLLMLICSTSVMPDTQTNTVSFTVKGQVVIPRSIRREFEIEDGTRAIVETTAEGILLKPITGKYIRSLRGKYKHLDLMKGLTQSRKEDREGDR